MMQRAGSCYHVGDIDSCCRYHIELDSLFAGGQALGISKLQLCGSCSPSIGRHAGQVGDRLWWGGVGPSEGREMSGMIGPGSCPPGPVRPVCAPASTTPFPHHPFSSRGQEMASVYIDALGVHFFSCLPTVSVWHLPSFPFLLISFAIYFHLAPRIGWSNRKLACPLHTIIYHRCYLEYNHLR